MKLAAMVCVADGVVHQGCTCHLAFMALAFRQCKWRGDSGAHGGGIEPASARGHVLAGALRRAAQELSRQFGATQDGAAAP